MSPTRQRPAAAADTYSAGEAAKLLGVSERRVRQLVDAGTLPGDRDRDGRLRLPQQAVHDERTRRRRSGRTSAGSAARSTPVAPRADVDVAAIVRETVEALVPRMLESATAAADRSASLAQQAVAEERAGRLQAEAEAAALRSRVAELEAARGLFRRRK